MLIHAFFLSLLQIFLYVLFLFFVEVFLEIQTIGNLLAKYISVFTGTLVYSKLLFRKKSNFAKANLRWLFSFLTASINELISLALLLIYSFNSLEIINSWLESPLSFQDLAPNWFSYFSLSMIVLILVLMTLASLGIKTILNYLALKPGQKQLSTIRVKDFFIPPS